MPYSTKADEGARSRSLQCREGPVAHSPAFVPVKHRNADHAHVAVAPCYLSSPVCLKHQAVPPLSDARIASMML